MAIEKIELPSILKQLEVVGSTLICELQGATPPLVQWASQQPLTDIRIGPPDLERLFHDLYHSEEAAP